MHEHFFFYLHIITHEISERAIQITRAKQEMTNIYIYIFIYDKLYFQNTNMVCMSKFTLNILSFDFNDYQGGDLDNDLAHCVIINNK